MEGNKTNSRRGFLNVLLGGTLATFFGMVIYPVIRLMEPPKLPEADISSVAVGKITDLKPDQSKLFKFGRQPGLLIRTSEGEFKAFIATCTHLDCTVQYRSDMKIIWCACHNGQYDLNGLNVAGPPPRPLTPLEVHIKDDAIFVSPKA
ncbi:plastoquinol--plastocyanin reductase [candidate division LCP-89 bacterium B3_LCP]|uniref:Plastoquinol--plastocyanin reductase n=1 Tax=candidate division LCP-89 bacterium B3_LCP TaxID=2012998 RepID=A0A532USR3_UNCL8|nr:MAG: plastoquinol--plastocyanin reductase [candidate division LCP-89 bacterium B3_LCP]